VEVTIAGLCPPDSGYEIAVDNPNNVPVEISQDGVVSGAVEAGSSQTFHSTSGSDNIAATAYGVPVEVTVTVVATSCPVLEPTFTG
jgi:hypothetical protein